MTLTWIRSKTLYFISSICRPKTACFVTTCCDDLVTLWVKRDFTDFVFVSLKDRCACSSKDIIYASHTICARSCQLVSCLIKASIEYFVVVTSEFFDALACTDVPEACRSVNTASQAIITSEIKLATGEFGRVPIQRM